MDATEEISLNSIKIYQILHQAIGVCHAHDITHVVLCPGSRSAPIALSFMKFKGIRHYVIPDERAAAYTALGLSRQLRKPVAVVCTSGTAALNFAPAVAEAFYSDIPLVVFTADRPAEWIGQADNQAIRQENIYGKNVKESYNFPTELIHPDTEWYAIRMINEAMNLANARPKGPVHINVPLREPLYLTEPLDISSIPAPKIMRLESGDTSIPSGILDQLKQYRKVLIIAGTHRPNAKLLKSLEACCGEGKNMVFIPDITSNLVNTNAAVAYAELVIDSMDAFEKKEFIPELVISFGGPVVSKTIKNFLRNKAIKAHWHLSGHPGSADVFQNLTKIFTFSAPAFFKAVAEDDSVQFHEPFSMRWNLKAEAIHAQLQAVLPGLSFSEIRATWEILTTLPSDTVLHLGNSLPVRLVSVFSRFQQPIEIYSNRGTSGIDGTVSSAAGQSMVDDRIHVLICGDLAFMYDSNGLWNNYLKENLKIIVFNNHGGGIFRNLPGARDQAELEEYFVVKQTLNFEHIALQHGCHYFFCNNEEALHSSLNQLYEAKGTPAVLEIEFEKNISISEVKEMLRDS